MRRFGTPFLLSMLVALAGLAWAEEPAVEGRVFLEIQAPPDPAFVHQELRLALRLGVERDFFEASVIQLFRQPLDVPVQLTAPWLDALPGAERLDAGSTGRETRSLVLNGRVVEAEVVGEEVRDERAFTVLLLEARYQVSEAPAVLALAAPTLRFAFGTRFEEDFVGGRVALDRRDVDVAGETRSLEVRPLPEEGRPEEFVDAVGRFLVSAAADPSERTAEGAFSLVLTIEGAGNLAGLTPPAPEHIEGFHVYGALDELVPGRRVVTYEIAPLSDEAEAVPAIAFAFFDPSPPARYRVATTAAIPLGEKAPSREPKPSPSSEGEPGAPAFPWGVVAFCAVLGALAVVWLARRRARREAEPVDPDADRKAEAATALRDAVARGDADPVGPFAEFLGAHLGRPAPAAIAPDLPVRLVEAGVPVELAADAASTLERLIQARYGGDGDPEAAARLGTLVDSLEAVLGGPARKR